MTTLVQHAGGPVPAARRGAPVDDAAWPLLLIVLMIPLALPYGLIMSIGGGPVRVAYPIYILGCAILVRAWHKENYPALVLAVFAFAPFLRRVADDRAGFLLINPILVAPYVALLPTLPSLLRQVMGFGRGSVWPFLLMLLCFIYAGFMSALQSLSAAHLFEAIRWVFPLAFATYLIGQSRNIDVIRRQVIRAILLILPILVFYGIYQYVVAPAWDVDWMLNLGSLSMAFGNPEPYKIRVYSMMNSPYSVALWAAMGMILLSGEGILGLIEAGTALSLLALTLVRTAWAGLLVGLLVLFIRGGPSRKLLLVLGAGLFGIVGMALLESQMLPGDVTTLVTNRFDTLYRLNSDFSARERESVYDTFFERLSDAPLGEGFGVNLSTASMAAKRNAEALDSGLLEAYLTFGVVGGTAYFIALAAMIAEAFRAAGRLRGELAGFFAAVCCSVAVLPLGPGQSGEVGVMAWCAFAILVATAYARAGEAAP